MSYLEPPNKHVTAVNKHVTTAQKTRERATIDLANVDFDEHDVKTAGVYAQAATAGALLSISHELKALRLAIEGPAKPS